MKRLSSIDAALWYTDTRNCPMTGASLMICDPASAPNFSFSAVRELLASRLAGLPLLRCRVAAAPLGLDRPWFVENGEADVDFHVRRIAVPTPGGRRELDELVGRLMSYPLDRARPLWEVWFIEGVEHGRVAILFKIHHALVDGVSGAALKDALFYDRAQPRQLLADAGQAPAPGIPRFGRRALAALVNVMILTPYRLVRLALQTLSVQRAVDGMASRPVLFFQAPITRFNAEVSPQRRISRSRVPLDRVKAVSQAFGVTLNDVMLALVSDAVRRYLQAREELPERPLVAQIGISTRHDVTTMGNQITSANVKLATDVADPVERLKTIRGGTQVAKQRAKTLAEHQVVGLTEATPPGLVALAVRGWAASHMGRRFAPINMIVSNVRGHEYQRYVAGAPIEQHATLGPLGVDMGMNITCISHHGWLEFGFITTPQIANDIDELADAIEPALRELEEAAGL